MEVFIPVVPALMSLLCRIASTAVIFIARLDGIQAEIKTVISAVTAAAITDSGDTQIRIGMTRLEPIDMKRSPISKSVTPMPAMPTKIPRGIPIRLTANASNSTLLRSCRLVAPIEDSSPNCLVRSDTEIEKAL